MCKSRIKIISHVIQPYNAIPLFISKAYETIDKIKWKHTSATIGKYSFNSRLIVGTGKYKDYDETKKALEEAKKELEKARKEIKEKLNDKKWQQEMQEELKKVNKEEIAREMEAAKKEMEKVKEELKAEKLNLADEMKKASAEMEKAKAEMRNYQDCIYAMEKEGLLSTKSDYRIEFKSGELFINEKKQPAETADRYKKYFSKDPVVIEKKEGIMNIRQKDWTI